MVPNRRGCLAGGFARRKAENLEQVGASGDGDIGERVVDTLKAYDGTSAGAQAQAKGSSERPRAEPGQPGTKREQSLGEVKSEDGSGVGDGLNNRPRRTHRSVEQSLEAQASTRGSRATGERGDDKRKEARTGDESVRLRSGNKPVNGGTLDVAAG